MKNHTLEEFKKLIKAAYKEQKWYFFTGVVNNHEVQLKLFPGKREVDVQIFKVNGYEAPTPRNYANKTDTLQILLIQLE